MIDIVLALIMGVPTETIARERRFVVPPLESFETLEDADQYAVQVLGVHPGDPDAWGMRWWDEAAA